MAVARYCPKCGIDRREGERFCRNCGQDLGTAAMGPPGAGETASEPTRPLAAALPVPVVPPPFAGDVLPPPPPAPPPDSQPTASIPPVDRGSQAAAVNPPLPFRPIALAGGLALVVSAFLPWLSVAGGSSDALELPIESLWDLEPADGPVKLGFAILVFGLLGAGLSLVHRTAWVRRLCGSLAVASVLAFALQLYRVFDQAGFGVGDVFEAIGAGIYVALAGGIALQVSR